MGNPFYIPRENSALDIMKLGLQLYGMKNQMDLGREENALKTRQLDQSAEQHAATQAQSAAELTAKNRQIDVMEQGNQIQANKLNPREKSFGTGDLVVMKNRWRMAGFEPEKMTEYFSILEPMAKDPNITRGQYAEQLVAGWDQGVKETITTSMAGSIDAILKKNPNADVSKQVEILNKIEATPQDKAMEVLFPDIVQYDQAEAARLKQSAAPTSDQIVAQIAMKVSSGEMPEKTGEALIAMIKGQKMRPVSVAPGGSLVNPETGEVMLTAPAAPKAPERPVIVPPGSTVLKDGKPVFTAPERPEKPEKGPTATEKRMTADHIAKAETLIMSNPDKPEIQPYIDKVNQLSTKPYAWGFEKQDKTFLGIKYGSGGKATKIPLPVIKGKQVTAKDIWDTAELNGMTYEEVLMQVLNFGKKK